jgi:hypothetical protein
MIINSNTLNGSFEDGVVGPWYGIISMSVTNDPVNAPHGSWYSVLGSGGGTAGANQLIFPNTNNGKIFLLSLNARSGIPGYNVFEVQLSGRTPTGSSVKATVTPILSPPISAGWQSYLYQLDMPFFWDANGLGLNLIFKNTGPILGPNHLAYLDNVVLQQQVPEPSFLVLFGLAGSFLIVSVQNRRPNH